MSRRDRLYEFVGEKVKELGHDMNGELRDDTALLSSGLLDSLSILQLASWIEQEMGSGMDLASVDIPAEWDTMGSILNFVEKNKPAGAQ